MKSCERCGSHAINEHMHGRVKGEDMKCPKCGSDQLNSEYKGAFACGTLTDRNGWYHQTNFCKEFAEFRKPLDETIAELTFENNALQARVKRLDEALTAYQEAYTPDGHVAPHDCFSTGPKTGHGFQDHVWCPGCYAESLAKQARESRP